MTNLAAVRADLAKGWTLPGDSAPIAWSAHAIDRFVERVRPTIDPDVVEAELNHMLASAVVQFKAPDWYRPATSAYATPAIAFLVLGDDIAMPLIEREGALVPMTALLKGKMINDETRSNVNRAKARKRAGRSARRVALKHEGGRPPRGPSIEEHLEGEGED